MNEFIESFGALQPTSDARDYHLVASAAAEYPEEFKLPTVTVKNQWNVSSCVAHAASSIVEYHHTRQEGYNMVFSTEFIYGFRDTGYYVGNGMYIRDALKTMQKYGDVPNDDLKGNHHVDDAMKNVKENLNNLLDKAYPHRITSYFRVYSEEEIKSALMNHGYVLASMDWHKDYKLVKGVYTPSDTRIGRHAIVLYGWDERGWLAQNSWGSLWGDGGRFVIPYDFKFNEMWGITDNITGDIVRPKRGKWYDIFYKVWNAIVNLFKFNKKEE